MYGIIDYFNIKPVGALFTHVPSSAKQIPLCRATATEKVKKAREPITTIPPPGDSKGTAINNYFVEIHKSHF